MRPSRVRATPHCLHIVAICAMLASAPASGGAQQSTPVIDASRVRYWLVGGALVAAAAVSDAAVERSTLAHRSHSLDDLAHAGNVLGTGRNLISTMVVVYAAGRLSHRRTIAKAVIHTAVGYAAGDLVASLGKPGFGRHRPDTTGSPWRFRPFASRGEWHSLPSAHTLHAFTIASAVSEEAHRPVVTALSYATASLVAWSRVYQDEHWASDVTSSAVVGAALGASAVRLLQSKRTTATRVRMAPWNRGISISFTW